MPNRILILTGDGKGKTTSAFGMALRALGRGMGVGIVQFIKHEGAGGEVAALRRFPEAEVLCSGLGFTPKRADSPQWARHASAALAGWETAERFLADPGKKTIVLDEIFYPIHFGLLSEDAVARALRALPDGKIVILTGRRAPEKLLALADTVSRIECARHALQQGVAAQEGFEF